VVARRQEGHRRRVAWRRLPARGVPAGALLLAPRAPAAIGRLTGCWALTSASSPYEAANPLAATSGNRTAAAIWRMLIETSVVLCFTLGRG
jgi:hypothetical protein